MGILKIQEKEIKRASLCMTSDNGRTKTEDQLKRGGQPWPSAGRSRSRKSWGEEQKFDTWGRAKVQGEGKHHNTVLGKERGGRRGFCGKDLKRNGIANRIVVALGVRKKEGGTKRLVPTLHRYS